MKPNTILPKTFWRSVRSLVISLFCGVLLFSFPQTNFAYDNDTHFWLTFYLARKAGYTNIQATQIASANVSVDYDPDTEPVLAWVNHWTDLYHPLGHFQNVVDTFHALPNKNAVITEAKKDKVILAHWWDPTIERSDNVQEAANKIVQIRKDEFWKDTIKKRENPGVFLHYAQDVYSHKKFKSWLGHGGYYYVDFLSSNCAEAKKMAFNTLKYLIIFRKYWLRENKNSENANVNYIDNLTKNDLVSVYNISLKDIDHIETTVERFVNDNPIPADEITIAGDYKYVESDLVKKWCKFSSKKKSGHYLMPPLTFIPTLWNNKNKQPVPNSYKARLIVCEKLNISDEELPYIWRYDLQNNRKNYLEKEETNRAFVYIDNEVLRKQANDKKQHFSKDESGNKRLEKICSSNQKYYLPFVLKDDLYKLPSDIRPCK